MKKIGGWWNDWVSQAIDRSIKNDGKCICRGCIDGGEWICKGCIHGGEWINGEWTTV